MNKLRFVLGCSCIAVGTSIAQPVADATGRWNVSFEGGGGGQRQAVLEIVGTSGTWKTIGKHNEKAKNHPCDERQFPVRVDQTTSAAFTFTVMRSAVVNGCEDWAVSLERTRDGSFEGQMNTERKIRLVR